jgi:uncharacterized glyoxalase superfamily protein PhnB
MLVNRSTPRSTVIPECEVEDVVEASDWLCRAFGFTVRVDIGSHRAQLNVGDGAVVLCERRPALGSRRAGRSSIIVRVDDVDRHHAQASLYGAKILRAPANHPYGERQYVCEDPEGNLWTFSQTIADVAPEEWGGVSGRL